METNEEVTAVDGRTVKYRLLNKARAWTRAEAEDGARRSFDEQVELQAAALEYARSLGWLPPGEGERLEQVAAGEQARADAERERVKVLEVAARELLGAAVPLHGPARPAEVLAAAARLRQVLP